LCKNFGLGVDESKINLGAFYYMHFINCFSESGSNRSTKKKQAVPNPHPTRTPIKGLTEKKIQKVENTE
jgi:hypothetical protein